MTRPLALIVGAGPGPGVSSSLARLLAPDYDLVLASRAPGKLAALTAETGAAAVQCDATDAGAVAALFAGLPRAPRVVLYNPSARIRGPIADLDPDEVRHVIDVTAFGAFLTGREATRAMLAAEPENGVRGTILFTGGSAGVKGFPLSAPFAMGKFAERGLAQSMARELHPKGIHVAWINIDGGIRKPGRDEAVPDALLDPDAIAEAYLGLINQPRSAWSDELTLRPWVETF